MFKSKIARLSAVSTALGAAVFVPVASAATAPDFSTLTASVDMSTVATAVMAVAAVMVGVYVAIKGAKIVLQMVRGA